MRKVLIVFLSILLVILLSSAGILAYLYSPGGNQKLRLYLEHLLTERTGLPIELAPFEFRRGHLYCIARIDHNASLGFDGQIDLLRQRVAGRYRLIVHRLTYQSYRLRQLDLSGTLQGTLDDLWVEGKGALLKGPVAFRVRLLHQQPRDVTVRADRLPIDALLEMAGQPALVHGRLRADIDMPSIGSTTSQGKAQIQLSQAHFDARKIQTLYHYTLPKDQTALTGVFRAQVDQAKATFDGEIVSDLLTVQIRNGQGNLADKTVACDVRLDAAELAAVTQNRLHGPLKMAGTFAYTAFGPQIRAATRSLGGDMTVDYGQTVVAQLRDVSLERLLAMAGQPHYATGTLNGMLRLDSPRGGQGNYLLKLTQGHLDTAEINRILGTTLPPKASLAMESRGHFADGVLRGVANVTSNVFDVTLRSLRYDPAHGALSSTYRLTLPDPSVLRGSTARKIHPIRLDGKLHYLDHLRLNGSASGLGKKVTFDYAGDRLKILAKSLALGRLLEGAGYPMYLSGPVDLEANFKSLEPLEGTFSVHSGTLHTRPKAIKTLLGRPLKTRMTFALKGAAQQGKLHAQSHLKSPLATLSLPDMTFAVRDQVLQSSFALTVPELADLEALIGTRLKGSFASKGTVRYARTIDLRGSSRSLGGELDYRYHGTQADVQLRAVPMPNVLRLLDQPEQLNGTIKGKWTYDTATRRGQAHASIRNFQFKPSKLTAAVKMVLHKDLAQVVYDRTVADARFDGDWIKYTIAAKGRRSDFSVRNGAFNMQKETNEARFDLRLDDVDVTGTVRGAIDDPDVRVLPGKMLRKKLQKRAIDHAKKHLGAPAKDAARGLIRKLPL